MRQAMMKKKNNGWIDVVVLSTATTTGPHAINLESGRPVLVFSSWFFPTLLCSFTVFNDNDLMICDHVMGQATYLLRLCDTAMWVLALHFGSSQTLFLSNKVLSDPQVPLCTFSLNLGFGLCSTRKTTTTSAAGGRDKTWEGCVTYGLHVSVGFCPVCVRKALYFYYITKKNVSLSCWLFDFFAKDLVNDFCC